MTTAEQLAGSSILGGFGAGRAELYQTERSDGDGRTMVINFGPQHPATHGTLRFILELDGETIVKLTPEIGYLHTGFEKLGEYRTWNNFVPLSDRTQYFSAMNNNIAFCSAVESLLDMDIPPRGRAVRVIMAELGRIADHILCTGLQGMDLGAFTVMLWGFIERERIYDIFDVTSGGRLTVSYGRVGGVAYDVPQDFEARVRNLLDKLPSVLHEMESMLSRNRIFCDRTQGVGILTRDMALQFGVTGPMSRASGCTYDVRRVRPYLDYEDLDFDVPTRTEGDVYARYEVRLAEIKESMKIIRQVLDRMPQGPVNGRAGKVTLPDKRSVYGSMEELIHHFELTMPGFGIQPPMGETYYAHECPNGEQGYYLVSDGSGIPYRVRLRSPSLYNYQAIIPMVTGSVMSDLVAVISSLNVIAGELDR